MANWNDIINNRITMGRSRWLCYGLNEERRRREQEDAEGRPGIRPSNGSREETSNGRDFENLRMENFQRHWVWGRGQAILIPRPYIQIHRGLVHPRLLQGVAVSFNRVTHGPGVDQFRFHIPRPQGRGQAVQGMGINLQRPCLAGPQHYQPPPLLQFQKKMLKMSPWSC